MSRWTAGGVVGALLVLGLGLYAVGGQAGDNPDAKNRRFVYVVKYGSAKGLAEALTKHYKGEAEVQVVADAGSNLLLISASPGVSDDLLKTLVQLDQRPQQVTVELWLADLKAEAPDKEPDVGDVSGKIEDVQAKLRDLQRKGVVGTVRRIQLTGLAGQPATLHEGESRAFVTGVSVRATGIASNNISYRDVGTRVSVVPVVTDGQSVVLDLNVEESRAHQPEDGVVLGTNEKGVPVHATEFTMASFRDRVSVSAGQAVQAKGVRTTSRKGQAYTLLIVGARLADGGDKK
jgi:hypothetical protein